MTTLKLLTAIGLGASFEVATNDVIRVLVGGAGETAVQSAGGLQCRVAVESDSLAGGGGSFVEHNGVVVLVAGGGGGAGVGSTIFSVFFPTLFSDRRC